MEQYVHKGALL